MDTLNTSSQERVTHAAPRMLLALQRLTHPMADDTDIDYARAVVAYATGHAELCDCHGLEQLCEDCGGTGCVPTLSVRG